jgi:hypothetical protein
MHLMQINKSAEAEKNLQRCRLTSKNMTPDFGLQLGKDALGIKRAGDQTLKNTHY